MNDIKCISAVDAAVAISEKLGISLADLVDVFADVPAADVTPVVHGRFISKGHWCVVCSYCGKMYTDYDGSISEANYCPNCAAKMDEVRK